MRMLIVLAAALAAGCPTPKIACDADADCPERLSCDLASGFCEAPVLSACDFADRARGVDEFDEFDGRLSDSGVNIDVDGAPHLAALFALTSPGDDGLGQTARVDFSAIGEEGMLAQFFDLERCVLEERFLFAPNEVSSDFSVFEELSLDEDASYLLMISAEDDHPFSFAVESLMCDNFFRGDAGRRCTPLIRESGCGANACLPNAQVCCVVPSAECGDGEDEIFGIEIVDSATCP